MTTRAAIKHNGLMTPDEAADVLTIHKRTLRECHDLGLRFVLVSRTKKAYRPEDVESYIRKRIVDQCHTEKKVRRSGGTTSKSGVVDFAVLQEQVTKKKQNGSKPKRG